VKDVRVGGDEIEWRDGLHDYRLTVTPSGAAGAAVETIE